MRASKVEIYSFTASSERCRRCEIRRQLYNGTRFQEYRPGLNVFSSLFTFAEVAEVRQTLLRVRFLTVPFSALRLRHDHFISWGGLWCFIVAEITIALHCSWNGAIACPTSDSDTQYVTHGKNKLTRFTKVLLLSNVVNESRLEYFVLLLFTSEPLRVNK